MNHAEVKRNLPDYLEGDLALEQRASVDAHLGECDECAREVAELQQTIGFLRNLPEPETPPMIAANVMRRIRAGETEPSGLARLGRALANILDPTFVLPASAIAVAALVVMIVQDPGALSRLTMGVGFDAGAEPGEAPRNPVSTLALTRAGARAEAFDAEIAGLDLPLPESFSFDRGEGAGSTASGSAVEESLAASRTESGSVVGAAGMMRFRFEVDSSKPLESIRVVPTRAPTRSVRSFRDSASYLASSSARAEYPSAQRVAQPSTGRLNAGMAAAAASNEDSSGGADPRDEWLRRGLEDPIDFARFLAQKNLAEQELWVARLADRAEARGLLDDLVQALRSSGDASAEILSDDFAAQSELRVPIESDWDARFQR